MKKYRLALQAEQDLIGILLLGMETWGYDQAKKYANELHDCFNTLAENPKIGVTRKDLKECPQSFVKGSHVIFYRMAGKIIEISRVLPQSMDIETFF